MDSLLAVLYCGAVLSERTRESRGGCFHFVWINKNYCSKPFYFNKVFVYHKLIYSLFFFSLKAFMQLLKSVGNVRRKLHPQCLNKVLSRCCLCCHCRSCVIVYKFCSEWGLAHTKLKFKVRSLCSYQLCYGVNEPCSWRNAGSKINLFVLLRKICTFLVQNKKS